jgi:hypothetical protein
MGYSAQVQQSPNQNSGKAGSQQQMTDATRQAVGNVTDAVQPQGKGGNYSMSATSGQPQMGAPNQYPNTIGIGDNTQQQQLPKMGGGKGKV